MEFHLGRLIDHVHLVVQDLEVSLRFYQPLLRALGRDISAEGDGWFHADELFVSHGPGATSRIHLAFQAPDRDAVERAWQAGIAAGGRDNGAPGERRYHPGYYAAYLLDPDGNNVEAVHHGPAMRSAPSVTVVPEI